MSLGTYKLPMRHPPDGVGAFFMSIIRQHPKKHKRQSRPPWGKVAPTGDGREELALKPRLPPNKDTEPSLPSMELRGLGGELRQVTTTTRFQRNHQPPYFLNSQNHAKITPESTRDRVWLPPNQSEGR